LRSRAEDQSSALFSSAIAAAVIIAFALFVVVPTGNQLFLSPLVLYLSILTLSKVEGEEPALAVAVACSSSNLNASSL
jgi:hypothetical protein